MASIIASVLGSIRIGEPIRHGKLTVFPLVGGDSAPIEYLHLDEAIDTQGLKVGETGSGVVAELEVTNECPLPVLILDGEVLLGGKQNRTVNTSVLVASGTTARIPVSCVEQGRWSAGARHRTSSHHTTSKIRASLKRSSLRSLRSEGTHRSDQGEVWREVRDVLSSSQSLSRTSDLSQAYVDHARALREAREEIRLPEDCLGILVAVNGKIVVGDLFGKRKTLSRYAARLLESAALDAMTAARSSPSGEEPGGEEPEVGVAEAKRFLDRAGATSEELYPAPGLGREIRGEDGELVVSALTVDETPVHVGFFAAV